MSYGPGNNSFSDVWDVIGTAFSFAHEAELKISQAQIPLLVELKSLAMHHWNIPLVKPKNNWVLIIWERLPVVEDHLEEEEMDYALTSFAIAYGLNQFADLEICQNPSSVMQKLARRWLNLALDVQRFSVPPNSAVISTLLRYGANPNEPLEEITPWIRILNHIAIHVRHRDLETLKLWAKFVKIFLDHGADPAASHNSLRISDSGMDLRGSRQPALVVLHQVFVAGLSQTGFGSNPEVIHIRKFVEQNNRAQKLKHRKLMRLAFWQRQKGTIGGIVGGT